MIDIPRFPMIVSMLAMKCLADRRGYDVLQRVVLDDAVFAEALPQLTRDADGERDERFVVVLPLDCPDYWPSLHRLASS